VGPPYLACVDGPYRNEIDSLRAENERLRAELSKTRVSRPILAITLAALDLGLAEALRPWLNGPSDAGFWAALGAVALLALVAAGAAVGRRRVV
jgi:hypothetical protein